MPVNGGPQILTVPGNPVSLNLDATVTGVLVIDATTGNMWRAKSSNPGDWELVNQQAINAARDQAIATAIAASS